VPEINKVRILLADDHALFRSGMKYVLAGLDGDVEIIEGSSYADAVKIAAENKDLDIALVDLSMPGLDNFNGLRRLREELGDVPIVVVSALDRGTEIRQAMECGISGYIPKTLESSIVLCALKLVFSGGVYLPPALLDKDRSRGDADSIEANGGEVARLTPRQSDVLALVARGLSNKEIARDLELAEGTVKLHVTALLKVLGVNNRTQAVVKANALGLTSRVSSEGTTAI
tara:strand:- start:220 stop:909 length:690 start_codon:yes stop_codon:yes gene_type:complete